MITDNVINIKKYLRTKFNKIIEIVKQYKRGISGAHIIEIQIDGKNYILKMVEKAGIIDKIALDSFIKEYEFYTLPNTTALKKNLGHLIPEILYSENNNEYVIIIMKKYEEVLSTDWNKELLDSMIDLITDVHICPLETVLDLGITPSKQEKITEGAINQGKVEWNIVLQEHGEYFDQTILDNIAVSFTKINDIMNNSGQYICHGDFHPGNILKDEDNNLILCDWQNINFNNGVGELSFFISRGLSSGLSLNKDELLGIYCTKLSMKLGIEYSFIELKKILCASTVMTNFLLWPNYLHGSERSRVENIYKEMLESFEYIVYN
jgi:serine/threonine protein kinase